MRGFAKIKYFLAVFFVLAATPAWAYVMSSTNYRMERDSINFGGGLSTSTSYSSESTFGEAGTGSSTAASYNLNAGYQQMDVTILSLTIPGNTAMTPTINGTVGGTANASAALNVKTNNSLGYTLQIKASTSPALQSGSNNFADYTLAGADPDYAWAVAASASEFGFTPEGTDIITRYKDDGASCNQALGSSTADTCWDPLSTTYNNIAQSSAGNLPSGADTAVKFRAEAGAAAGQANGTYTATVIFTALAN